jgi:hypothetical protein
MNEGIEDCYRLYIITSSFKTKLKGRVKLSLFRYGSQSGLAKPLKNSSKSWPMLLVDEYDGGRFSISLATFGALGFPFLVIG